MEEKEKNYLIEILLNKGEIYRSSSISKEEWEAILDKFDLREKAERLKELEYDLTYSEDHIQVHKLCEEVKGIKNEIMDLCKDKLMEAGIDIEKALGKEASEAEKKAMLEEQLKQLEWLGISLEEAKKVGLDNLDALVQEGKEFAFYLEDTPEVEEFCKKHDIDFEKENGKVRLNINVSVKEGVAVDDTEEARKFLDENEIRYIKYAQRETLGDTMKEKLFIPYNWGNKLFPVTNSQLVRNAEKLALLAAASFVITPAWSILLLYAMKRTGIYQNILKEKELSKAQIKALQNGLTAYKKEGKLERYYFMDNGRLRTVNARDVRLPNVIRGIRLSPADMEKLRTGELVILKTKNGEEFGVRIDVTKPNAIQEYYKEMRSDREMKAVPTRLSPEKDKLDWIARKGFEGIVDIYGNKNINLERDSFLSKFGIKSNYTDIAALKGRLPQADEVKRKEIFTEIITEDGKLKAKAQSESINLVKEAKKGMSL